MEIALSGGGSVNPSLAFYEIGPDKFIYKFMNYGYIEKKIGLKMYL
jgi:hypothetical protein